jgi:UDPglucose 6-dehydrogenase
MPPLTVTVVGTGYVGLVTGACLSELGHDVTCVDVRQPVVDGVNAGRAPFFEPGLEDLVRSGLDRGRFRASTDLTSAVQASDVSFIAVGTPSTADGIDLSAVAHAAGAIGEALRSASRYHVVVVKSTVVPGSTDGPIRQVLEDRSQRSIGDIGLCMNPEFLREGSAVDDFMRPDRIVIGEADSRAGARVAELYDGLACPVIRTTTRNAELIKYTSNALLATLVSFSNELAGVCEALPDTDVDAVMDAVHLDRRLTPIVDGRPITPGIVSYLRAGSGFGGSCLPKDVTALRMWARSINATTPLLDAVMQINELRPQQVAALVDTAAGGVRGRPIAVLGLAFKPGTDDLRDSPALSLLAALAARGAVVRAYDPLLSNGGRAPLELNGATLAATPEAALSGADAAVIATGWPEFRDWNWAGLSQTMRSRTIVDARNALRGVSLPEGVRYYPIGRCGL